MKINLLLIKIFNKKKYKTRFIYKKIKIINLIFKIIIIFKSKKNNLY